MKISSSYLIPKITPIERSKKAHDDFNTEADCARATKNHRDKIKRKETDTPKAKERDQNLLGKA